MRDSERPAGLCTGSQPLVQLYPNLVGMLPLPIALVPTVMSVKASGFL